MIHHNGESVDNITIYSLLNFLIHNSSPSSNQSIFILDACFWEAKGVRGVGSASFKDGQESRTFYEKKKKETQKI
jgi:hypothetical protein